MAVLPREHELVALGPPAAKERSDLGGRRRLGPPGLDVGRPELERRSRQLEDDVDRRRARAGVRQDSGARLRLAVQVQARQEPGHRAAVAAEDPPLVVHELDAEAPADRPVVRVEHHLRRPELVRRRLVENALCALGQHDGPPRQVADRRPQLPHGGDAMERCVRLAVGGARVLVDEVSGGARRLLVPGRPGEVERSEDPAVDVVRVGLAAQPGDDLAQHAVGEVRVVVRAGGGEHELVLVHRVDHLVDRRRLARHPHVARLALQAGEVREHPAQRWRADRDPRQVLLQAVVEVELAGVAQLHHRDGGEGLRDRADAVLGVGGRLCGALVVGRADRVGPHALAAANHGRGERRQPLRLARLEDPLQALLEALRQGRGHPGRPARARLPARRRRRRCRGGSPRAAAPAPPCR